MQRRYSVVIPAFILVLLLAACSGGGDSSRAEKFQASVDSDWKNYQQTSGVPGGGLAIYVETPTGNYFAASGMPAGVSANSRFRIASNTKTFTASAIMLLNQQGLLNIDDTIVANIPNTSTPYVPDTAAYNIPHKTNITIRQLLSHTAGVFDVTNEKIPASCNVPYAGQFYAQYVLSSDPNHQFSPDELVGVAALCQASYFVPGADYKYSNQGYSILATIIERVSGLPYDQFVIQNLLAPNGLASTSIPMLGTDQTLPSPFTPGYMWSGGEFNDVTVSNMSLNIAEGNIISTPADLARWIRRLLKAEAGPDEASVAAMMIPTAQSIAKGNSYGLGIAYVNGLGYGHSGAHFGYLSQMSYDPENDVTTIIYSNVWDYANLLTAEANILLQAGRNARAAAGY